MKAKSIFSLMPLIQLSKRRFIMVSKKAIYNLIPQKYYPITELIRGQRWKLRPIEQAFIQYFCKTDIGLRGSEKKIRYKS
jgi:hypothetical protein